MAQKANPKALRLGLVVPWSSRWFFKKSLRYFIEEDQLIYRLVREKVLQAGLASVNIERLGDQIKVIIRAARPGLIIGRGGKGVDELRILIQKKIVALRKKNNQPLNFILNINIEELKRSEVSAAVIAQQIAFDIEKRLPYRSVIKRALQLIMQNREVKGAKIKVAGRLNGAEIARRDQIHEGQMPLQTLRANIDYGEATAFNTYGTVGIKVWIYKGEIFDKDLNSKLEKEV
jgi:small subunit ribosomal protein S3